MNESSSLPQQAKEFGNEAPVAFKAGDAPPQNTSDLNSLRVKVAELCGVERGFRQDGTSLLYSNPGEPSEIYWRSTGEIFDPTRDLNACAELERTLDNIAWWRYVEYLTGICGGGIALCISATAEHRCRAFVATMEVA